MKKAEIRWVDLIVLLTVGVIILYIFNLYVGDPIIRHDTALFACAARNIAEGKGLTSPITNPSALPSLKEHPINKDFPYKQDPLIQPILEAFAFKVWGQNKSAIVLVNSLFYLLNLALLYILSGLIYKSRRIAIISALVLMIEPHILNLTISGASEICFMSFLILCALMLVKSVNPVRCLLSNGVNKYRIWYVFAGGIALGLSQYARPTGIAFALPFILFLYLPNKEQRTKTITTFVLGFALMMMPLFLRNQATFGVTTPLLAEKFLYVTRGFPGLSSYLSLTPTNIWEVLNEYGGDILLKWAKHFAAHFVNLLTLTHPIVVSFTLIGMIIYSSQNKMERALRILMLSSFLCVAAINSIFCWSNRYVVPLVPFFIVLFSGVTWRAFREIIHNKTKRILAILILGFLILSPTLIAIYNGFEDKTVRIQTHNALLKFGAFIKENVKEDEIIATDDYCAVAWYGRRRVLALPVDPETAEKIISDYLPFDVIILTSLRINNPTVVFSHIWKEAYRDGRDVLNFKIDKIFKEGTIRAVLLRADKS